MRSMALHRNDGNTTPYIVVVTGKNGITATCYESSWEKARARVDEAASSPFCVDVHAYNADTGESYP